MTTVTAEGVIDTTSSVVATAPEGGPQDDWFQVSAHGSWAGIATGPVVDKAAIRVVKRERPVKVLSEEEQAKVDAAAAQKAKVAKAKAEKAQKRRDLEDMDPRDRPAPKNPADIALQSKSCPGFFPGQAAHEKESRDDDYCRNCLRDKRRWLSRCPNFKDTDDRAGCKGYRYYDKEAEEYVPLCSTCYGETKKADAPWCPYSDECGNLLMWNSRADDYFEFCKPCQNILDKRCPNYSGGPGRPGCGGHRRWNHDLKKYVGFCRECSEIVGPRPKGFRRNDTPPAEY